MTPERRAEILAHAERFRWRPYVGLATMARDITELDAEIDRLNQAGAYLQNELDAAREHHAWMLRDRDRWREEYLKASAGTDRLSVDAARSVPPVSCGPSPNGLCCACGGAVGHAGADR